MQIDFSSATLLAIGTTIVAAWQQIRQIITVVFHLPFQVTIVHAEVAQLLANRLMRPKFSLARTLQGRSVMRGSTQRIVIVESREGWVAGWYSGMPLVVLNGSQIVSLRGVGNIEKVVARATLEVSRAYSAHQRVDRFTVARFVGMGSVHRSPAEASTRPKRATQDASAPADEITHTRSPNDVLCRPVSLVHTDQADDAIHPATLEDLRATPRSLCRMYFHPPEMQAVTNRIRQWVGSSEWYEKHELPWRLGILLTGVAGTGKSTYAAWIAETFRLPLYIFDLASMSNEDFTNAWSVAARRAPAVVLLEDIDGIFNGRTNIVGELGGGLSFDCLINAMSGVSDCSGLLVFVTSNMPDKIDAALRYRPGRIDVEVEVLGLCDEGQAHMVSVVCESPVTKRKLLAEYAGRYPPAAVFRNACVAAALQDEADRLASTAQQA